MNDSPKDRAFVLFGAFGLNGVGSRLIDPSGNEYIATQGQVGTQADNRQVNLVPQVPVRAEIKFVSVSSNPIAIALLRLACSSNDLQNFGQGEWYADFRNVRLTK